MSTAKTEAVKTAGERLEQIEAWSRRTFIAAVVAAAFAGVVALVAVGVGVEYLRIKWAATEAVDRMKSDMEKSRQELQERLKSRPATKAPASRGVF